MIKLKVSSMNCKSCVHNIEDHLKEFDNNISLEFDLKNKIITVKGDYPSEQVLKLVEDAGYPAELI